MPNDRMGFIGGSDIASVMGLSRWKTPLQLWAEKTGQVEPDDLSNNEAVEMGNELEDTVARLFTKRTGMAVRRSPWRYYHPNYDQFQCQVDRLVTKTDELLECKTCSFRKEKEWAGEEIPVEYILQVQWQLLITGRKVGWIAVLIGGQKFLYKKIEADGELQQKMLESAVAFWDMIEKKIPPVVEGDDNAFMVKLHPKASEEIREASEDFNASIALLQQTKAQIIDLEATKNELEAKIKSAIGDLKGIKTKEYTAKWVNIKGSTFTVTKPDGRQLRISKNEGEENE